MKLLVLLVGESGSGKTTLINSLCKYFKYHKIDSYTTRPPRYEGEPGHIFIKESQYKFAKINDGVSIRDLNTLNSVDYIAYTYFDGHHYWAQKDQILEGVTLYTLDPAGIESLRNHLPEDTYCLTLYLASSDETRRERMRLRGDSEEKIENRISHDKEAFSLVRVDYVINTESFSKNNLPYLVDGIILKELERIKGGE